MQSVGDACEGLTAEDEWKPGTINEIDMDDEDTPYLVQFDGADEGEWVAKVRAVGEGGSDGDDPAQLGYGPGRGRARAPVWAPRTPSSGPATVA